MTQQKFTLSAVATLAVIASCTIAMAQDISVTPVRISESRTKILESTAKKSYSYNSVSLTLRLSGKSIEKMTRIGKLQVKAVDDKGNAIPNRSNFSLSSRSLRRVTRRTSDFRGKPLPQDRYEFNVYFTPPARGASSIAEVTGSVTVRIAETVDVLIPIEDLQGKKKGDALPNAELTKLGVAVEVDSFSAGNSASVRLRITGEKKDSLVGCKFVDGNGKDLGGYGSTFTLTKYTSVSSRVSKKLPKGSKVKISFEKSYKDVEVSLNKKDIPLP